MPLINPDFLGRNTTAFAAHPTRGVCPTRLQYTLESSKCKVQRLVCISGPPAQSLMLCMLQCDPAARPGRGRLTKISQPVSISRGGTDTLISFRCIMEFSVRVSYLVVYIVRLLTIPLYPSLLNLRRTTAVVFAYLVSGDGRS